MLLSLTWREADLLGTSLSIYPYSDIQELRISYKMSSRLDELAEKIFNSNSDSTTRIMLSLTQQENELIKKAFSCHYDRHIHICSEIYKAFSNDKCTQKKKKYYEEILNDFREQLKVFMSVAMKLQD